MANFNGIRWELTNVDWSRWFVGKGMFGSRKKVENREDRKRGARLSIILFFTVGKDMVSVTWECNMVGGAGCMK